MNLGRRTGEDTRPYMGMGEGILRLRSEQVLTSQRTRR
jgi:hypothetical protein